MGTDLITSVMCLHHRTAKAIIEHDELKDFFLSIKPHYEESFKLLKLDLMDFPKINSSDDMIHFITKGMHSHVGKVPEFYSLFSIDNEKLHGQVKWGQDIENTILNNANFNVANWTYNGDTLFHTAAKRDNFTALNALISQVSKETKYCNGIALQG